MRARFGRFLTRCRRLTASPSLSMVPRAVVAGIVAVLALGGGGAWASPSGLLVIPVADILGPGEVSANLISQGPNALWSGHRHHLVGLEVGLPGGWEAGVDAALDTDEPNGPWVNAKWQVPTRDPERMAVALGLQNVGHRDTAQPYLALSRALGTGRAHAGVIRAEGKTRWMLGAEAPGGRRLTLLGDYLSGAEGSTALGLGYELAPRWGVVAGYLWNRGEESRNHSYFEVGYSWEAF